MDSSDIMGAGFNIYYSARIGCLSHGWARLFRSLPLLDGLVPKRHKNMHSVERR